MKKILLSIATVAIAGATIAGATGAWFTNVETSTGNTFVAGVIDLKIDNESYVTNNDGVLVASAETSWQSEDLDKGQLFFNFMDLKPGDVGEDTISVHVGDNDAWACMDIDVTATPENGQTEPELLLDETLGDDEGELQDELEFVFWKDDGDNVLEMGEFPFLGEKKEAMTIQDFSNMPSISLADSLGDGLLERSGPLAGGEDYYIGKAWCQGALSLAPLDQDGFGKNGDNGPLDRGTGISCDGAVINDASQTDGISVDVSFSVEQSRHNDNFLCNPPEEGTLTVVKEIEGGFITDPDDFDLTIDGELVNSGDMTTVSAGTHTVSEDMDSNYIATYSDNCSGGTINVPANESVTCTITNTYTQGTLTVTKVVEGGPLAAGEFDLYVGDLPVDNGETNVMPEGDYRVREGYNPDYTAAFSGDCDDEGVVTVTANGAASCTIINTYTMGTLTVNKIVEGTMGNENDLIASNFELSVNDGVVENGEINSFSAGDLLIVTEDGDEKYTSSFSGDCNSDGEVTLAVGENAECTITNTYNRATLTVDKMVTFSSVTTDVDVNDFTLHITNEDDINRDVTDEVAVIDLPEGIYTVTETYTGAGPTPTYTAEYGLSCNDDDDDNDGEVTLVAGDNKTCRIINLIQD